MVMLIMMVIAEDDKRRTKDVEMFGPCVTNPGETSWAGDRTG